MKGLNVLILFELVLSALSAFLLSKISWWGKVGIFFFYRDYAILKNPWQTGAIIIGIQLFLILLMYALQRQFKTKIFSGLILLLALVGLAYTYYDFTETFNHRILKEKFHLGGYLFWFGMIVSSVFFLAKPISKSADAARQSL